MVVLLPLMFVPSVLTVAPLVLAPLVFTTLQCVAFVLEQLFKAPLIFPALVFHELALPAFVFAALVFHELALPAFVFAALVFHELALPAFVFAALVFHELVLAAFVFAALVFHELVLAAFVFAALVFHELVLAAFVFAALVFHELVLAAFVFAALVFHQLALSTLVTALLAVHLMSSTPIAPADLMLLLRTSCCSCGPHVDLLFKMREERISQRLFTFPQISQKAQEASAQPPATPSNVSPARNRLYSREHGRFKTSPVMGICLAVLPGAARQAELVSARTTQPPRLLTVAMPDPSASLPARRRTASRRREIWVAGYPSPYGGADTELDHQIDLWLSYGVAVHLVPNGQPDTTMRNDLTARGAVTRRVPPRYLCR